MNPDAKLPLRYLVQDPSSAYRFNPVNLCYVHHTEYSMVPIRQHALLIDHAHLSIFIYLYIYQNII